MTGDISLSLQHITKHQDITVCFYFYSVFKWLMEHLRVSNVATKAEVWFDTSFQATQDQKKKKAEEKEGRVKLSTTKPVSLCKFYICLWKRRSFFLSPAAFVQHYRASLVFSACKYVTSGETCALTGRTAPSSTEQCEWLCSQTKHS